ncbi:S-layer homology domain-containing protein [Patescibacteria group bacterium]|nr:S-layer homology domain-containing protein [Patescibacteria group bacterium]
MALKNKIFVFGLLAAVLLSIGLALHVSVQSSKALTSLVPVISEVQTFGTYPSDGVMTIHASNLSNEEDENIVFVGDRQLYVAEVRDGPSEMDVIISSNQTDGNLTITVNGQTSEPFPLDFPTPEITSLEFPNGQEPEADFFIHGTGFTSGYARPSVSIYAENNSYTYDLDISFFSDTKITATLPDEAFQGYLTVEKDGWYSNSENIDLLLLPEIHELDFQGSTGVKLGEELIIRGANFNKTLSKNIITFDDGDTNPDEGIETTPYFVDEDELDELKVLVPINAKSGILFITINEFESNRVEYSLKDGPTIQFNERNAYIDSDSGHVFLSIYSNEFSSSQDQNVIYVNGAAATTLGQFSVNTLRVDLGLPDATGKIYAETDGYKGPEVEYNFTWLLVPNISIMTTSAGFLPGRTITLTGINFKEDTILDKGDGEYELDLEYISHNQMFAQISLGATDGQIIQIRLRNGSYLGNLLSFIVGDLSKVIEAEPEETIPPSFGSTGTEETPFEPVFPDVLENDWFASYVITLYNEGIVQGKSDLLFHPADNVTRAEFLKMAIKSKGITPNVSTQSGFLDIENHWAKPYILYAETARYIDSSNYFRPDDPISRAEAIKILLKVYSISTDGVTNEYFIDTLTHWAVFYAAKAYEDGIVEGETVEGNRYFYPDRQMNRAEAAKIISLML